MRDRWPFGVWWVLGAALGCEPSTVAGSFQPDDAGSANGDAGTDAGMQPGSPPSDEPDTGFALGGRCLDADQCDDGIDCTFDDCDPELGRCKFTPDDSRCADGVFCNGVEQCSTALGCRAGPPMTCTDATACTIDICIEDGNACQHELRDADGDGDPDHLCQGGGDCNETDPRVASSLPEVCDNDQDDDCDGDVDEAECEAAEYDTCDRPLQISASGNFTLSPLVANADYGVTCFENDAVARDLVLELVVADGQPRDIDVVATTSGRSIALARMGVCGEASSEQACVRDGVTTAGDSVARLRYRGLSAGSYPLYVLSRDSTPIALSVEFQDTSLPPTNETCGTAVEITAGEHVRAELVEVDADVPSECAGEVGDLVYFFDLSEPRDVRLYATALDNLGTPVLSLQRADCAEPEATAASELRCVEGQNAELFARSLAPGRYFVRVGASGPALVDVVLNFEPPSQPPTNENCEGAPPLTAGSAIDVDLSSYVDDATDDCLQRAVDAAYSLSLDQASDVLLIQRLSDDDTGALSLHEPDCAADAARVCSSGARSPLRAAAHALEAGEYRVVVESAQGKPVQLTTLTRPARAPIFVAFADSCDEAPLIPEGGGFFQGNTANARADYDSGCDLGGMPPGAASDQMLRLKLEAERRVILDMQGSAYATLLSVRRADGCPGDELLNACSAGFRSDRSYLDLKLQKGQYYVQVDGYAGASGQWFLDVFIVEP